MASACLAASATDAPIPQLHLYLGHVLTRLTQYDEAAMEYRRELELFPQSLDAYEGVAAMYHAADRDADIESVVKDLLEAHPTVAGYAVAVRIWTTAGERRTAEALRGEARRRFKGDPALPLLGRAR